MSATQIAGVLVDVGGTLWPERWEASQTDSEERASRLAAALGVASDRAEEMVRLLERDGALASGQTTQSTSGLIRKTAATLALTLGESDLIAVRRAMCLAAAGRWELFPGAVELLATIKALGASCVLLSNGTWRDNESYRRDLHDFGISRFIDAIVTSVDCGFRKPDERAFDAALAAAGCSASECAMIGNSEENDIAPALVLGMRTIRVAIEEARPAASSAHAVAGSLHETAEILRSWVWSDGASP